MTPFTPPVKDPAFLRWVKDLLESNYGCPLEPYEIIGQLEMATGFTEAEICAELNYADDHFAEPV